MCGHCVCVKTPPPSTTTFFLSIFFHNVDFNLMDDPPPPPPPLSSSSTLTSWSLKTLFNNIYKELTRLFGNKLLGNNNNNNSRSILMLMMMTMMKGRMRITHTKAGSKSLFCVYKKKNLFRFKKEIFSVRNHVVFFHILQ